MLSRPRFGMESAWARISSMVSFGWMTPKLVIPKRKEAVPSGPIKTPFKREDTSLCESLNGGISSDAAIRCGDSILVKNTYDEFNLFLGIKGKITQNAEFALDMGGNSSADYGLTCEVPFDCDV